MTDSQDKSRKNHGQIRSSLFRSSIWLSQRERGPLPCPPSTRRICPCVCCRRKCFISRRTRGGTPSIYLRSALLGLDPPPRPQPMPLRSPPSSSPLCDSPRCVADDDDDAAAPVVVIVVAATVVVVVVAALAVSIAFAIPSTLLCTTLFDCCVADDDDAAAVVVTAATVVVIVVAIVAVTIPSTLLI